MNILFAGGTGLLGGYLTQAFLDEGIELWNLTRGPTGDRNCVHNVTWDGATSRGWGDLVNQMDAVINLAGENIGGGRWTPERKEAILRSRVQAGQAITQAIQQATHRPEVVIQASGVGAYGPCGDEAIDETHPYGKDFLSGVCVEWEKSTAGVKSLGVRHVILRTGLVVTPEGGFMKPLLLAYRLFAGGPYGNGRQYWPWIHYEDYVRAVSFVLKNKEITGPVNVVAPNPCRMEVFGIALANTLSRPYLLPAPAFALRLLMGEMSTLILDGQCALPMRLKEAGFKYKFVQINGALNNLFKDRR